jgi:pyrroline-5-carboxylate reductase
MSDTEVTFPYSAPVIAASLEHVRGIAVIGAGTMARAIATGLVRARAVAPDRIAVTDRVTAKATALARETGVRAVLSNTAAVAASDVVIVCTKPADVRAVLSDLSEQGAFARLPLLISIAAGVRISALEASLVAPGRVVRAMPNAPCRVGKGMTAITGGSHADVRDLALASQIFSSVGRCIELEERLFDAFTALCGSGPALAYLVIEALADGAVACGVARAAALEAAAATLCGAAETVLETGAHPATLRDEVTTPGGCTIAGLLVLEDGRARSLFARAVQEAARAAAGLDR